LKLKSKEGRVCVGELPVAEIKKKLVTDGLRIKIGPFNTSLNSSINSVFQHVKELYSAFPLVKEDEIIDFYVRLEPTSSLRRWVRPQVNFSFDGYHPFLPLPLIQAGAMFEWGLNWCIANYSHQYLIVHAAVIEYKGHAFIFPGSPGSGKSTLCAALAENGWRLLSDEMGLISLLDYQLYPVPRPISLKNESIEVIQKYSRNAVFGQTFLDTAKGTLSHLRPSNEAVYQKDISAKASKIIFPKYKQNSNTDLKPITKASTLLQLADNTFNYSVLGKTGFDTLTEVVDNADCYEFTYSNLIEAIEKMDYLCD